MSEIEDTQKRFHDRPRKPRVFPCRGGVDANKTDPSLMAALVAKPTPDLAALRENAYQNQRLHKYSNRKPDMSVPASTVLYLLDANESLSARLAECEQQADSAEAALVTERAMHSAALERADALGDKLQQSEAAAAAMREFVVAYLQECWDSFARVVEGCDDNGIEVPDYLALTAQDLRAQDAASSTAGRELLAELERLREENSRWIKQNAELARNQGTDWEEVKAENAAYREWVPRAVEAMKGVDKTLCRDGYYSDGTARAALSAAIASAPKQKGTSND